MRKKFHGLFFTHHEYGEISLTFIHSEFYSHCVEKLAADGKYYVYLFDQIISLVYK